MKQTRWLRYSNLFFTFVLVALLCPYPEAFAGQEAGEPDDLIPRYLVADPDSSRLEPPPLTFRRRIALQGSEELGLRRCFRVLPAEDGYYIPTDQGLAHFDQSGNLVRLLGADLLRRGELRQLRSVAVERGTFRICDHSRRSRVIALDVLGDIQESFELGFGYFDGMTRLQDGKYLLSLLLSEPYGALLENDHVIKKFISERRKLLPPEQEYRQNLGPRFYMAADQNGEIYAVNHVDYEIRKYTSNGSYLGDFRRCSDSDYRPPPGSADVKRWPADPEYADQWLWSWSRVVGAEVVDDRYLVVGLQTREKGKYRLHIYTLDGQVAFQPVNWEWELADADRGGNLYFQKKDENDYVRELEVYGIGPERLAEVDYRVPAATSVRTTDEAEAKVPAPDFSVKDLDGREISLEGLRGRVVVLNFWFVACAPCRGEIPQLNRLVDTFQDRKVTFLAPAANQPEELREFLGKTEFKYQVVSDPDAELAGKYQVHSAPVHVIIDQQGNIDSVLLSASKHRGEDLRRRIEMLLEQ